MRETSVERKRKSLPEAAFLPAEQKRLLVLELFKEFGIERYRQSGYELTHRCTLGLGGHSDGNSWTASINYDTLEFNCFVCHNGGPLYWWIAVMRGESDDERVVEWLKKKAGLNGAMDLQTVLAVVDSLLYPKSERETLPYYDDSLLHRWNAGRDFIPYLTDSIEQGGRNISADNLRRYEVGYAESDDDFRYHKRIIIPVRWRGNLVGWQARLTDKDDPEPDIKYKNSPGFPRNQVLYGDVERNRNPKIVVESPMSVLRHSHNLDMIATFGSKVTDMQIQLLSKYDRLIVCMDPDKAGYSATRTILNKVGRNAIIDVWDNPYNGDPADMDELTFLNLVDSAVPGSLWQPKYYHELKSLK